MERRSAHSKAPPPPSSLQLDDYDSETNMVVSDDDSHSNSDAREAKGKGKANPKKRKLTQGKKDKLGSTQPPVKKLRGKRGLLKDFVQMPLDVLFEIIERLEPIDLLSLSRTSKDLRAILMSRSSISVWKQAFNNLEHPLPECPFDLNEPQYAELAFGRSCYYCLRNLAVVHTGWRARVRTCSKCVDLNFRVLSDHPSWEYPSQVGVRLPTIVIRSTGRREKRKTYYSREADKLFSTEYKSLIDQPQRNAWVQKKVSEGNLIYEHAKLCERWAAERQSDREKDRKSLVDERKAIVVEHLKQLGWEDELGMLQGQQPQNTPEVVKACQKHLTERALQNLEGFLNEFMERVKEKRIMRERMDNFQSRVKSLKKAYNDYLTELPPDGIYPNTAELIQHAVINEIANDVSSPKFGPEQRDVLVSAFPDAIEDWHEKNRQQVIQLITTNSASTFKFDIETVMENISTYFLCSSCRGYLQAKELAAHACAWKGPGYGIVIEGEVELVWSAIGEVPWNTNKSLRFQSSVVEEVALVLKSCGFDPASTTQEDIDQGDPIFECLACNDERYGRSTMRSTGLGDHLNRRHTNLEKSFVVLSDEEATVVRARMKEDEERHWATATSHNYICTHCMRKDNMVTLLAHAREIHVARPRVGNDIIIAPGTVRPAATFMLWPPRDPADIALIKSG